MANETTIYCLSKPTQQLINCCHLHPAETMLSSQHTFKLKKPVLRLDHFMPAFDDTLVIGAMTSLGKESLLHINKEGKVLCKYDMNDYIYSLVMPTDDQAIVINVELNQIIQLNLRTQRIMLYPFHCFTIQEPCQVNMEMFFQTNMLCIRENGQANDNRLVLTYYSLPLPPNQKEIRQPVVKFESQENQWTFEHTIYKGNNHSMIIWCKQRHDMQFQVKTFDTRHDPKGQYRVFSIKNSIGQPYGLPRVNTGIVYIWEMRGGVFGMFLQSELAQFHATNDNADYQNIYLWDTNQGKVCPSGIVIQQEYRDFLIDFMSWGEFTMIRTFKFNNEGALFSPAYYVDNSAGKVVAEETWKVSHLSKWSYPNYDPTTLCEGIFQNGDVDKIELKKRRIMEPLEASRQLLKCWPGEEQWDDDLLNQTMDIISYQK